MQRSIELGLLFRMVSSAVMTSSCHNSIRRLASMTSLVNTRRCVDNTKNNLASIKRQKTTQTTTYGNNVDYVVSSPHPDEDLAAIENVPLPHYIMNEFKKYQNLTAMVDGVTGRQITYGQLETMIARVGSWLVKHQLVHKGSVVTVYGTNCIEYTVTYLAVTSAGAIVSPVSPSSTVGDIVRSINMVGSSVLFTAGTLVSHAKQASMQCPSVKKIIVFGDSNDVDCQPFSSLLSDDMSHFPTNVDINTRGDIIALPFSSGTTGLPKGVMLTHFCVAANVIQSKSKYAMNYLPGMDSVMAVLPFFHIYGQVMVMLAGLVSGAKIVTLPKFEPRSFLDSIQRHKVTFVPLAPPMILFLAQHPSVSEYDFSSVRGMMNGAAPADDSIMERAIDRCRNSKITIQQGYGMTEASPLTHMHPVFDIKRGTVGPAVSRTQFKVVDVETGQSLGPGKSGEICIRGPQLMKGYYNNQKATDETLRNGWLYTGDLGRFDEEGHLIIEDRIKELIKVKGFQVAPAELEAILLSHLAVQDTAVIGRPDERAGELPTAFVVLKPHHKVTEIDLQRFVSERVAAYKQLAGGVIFCSEIPKSASGKILRRQLKTELLNKTGSSSR